MPFDSTQGGSQSTSYATRAEADEYFARQLYATLWNSATNTVKETALMMACARLEAETYTGGRASATQRLTHPRAGLSDDDGYAYDSATVMRPLKEAQFALALHYLKNDPAEVVDESLRQFKHLRIAGALEIELRDTLPGRDSLPAHVLRLISRFLLSGPGQIRLVRG